MRARSVDDESVPSPGIGHNTPPEAYALPPDKLADMMGLPADTLDKLRRAGRGPLFFKIGRRLYCRVRDFHRWLDDCATGKIDATLVEKRRVPRVDGMPARGVRPPSRKSKAAARAGKIAPRRPKHGEERATASD